MKLKDLKDSLQTEALVVVSSFSMDDQFTMNTQHNRTYPHIQMDIPNSEEQKAPENYEDYSIKFGVCNLKGQKTIDEVLQEMEDLEGFGTSFVNRIRALLRLQNDIKDITTPITKTRTTTAFNDVLVWVFYEFTLRVWSGNVCE